MTEKELVLKAIKDGEYEVEIEEPNNVRYCERYDGTPFYIMVGDDIKFGVWAGSCTVHVREHSFVCDLDYGEWSGDDLLDDDIIEALEDADRVIYGEHMGTDAQWEVYAAANNITEDIPYFWCEDDDRYKDVDGLDWYEEDIEFQYSEAGSEEWRDCDTEVNCQDIYELYKAVKESHAEQLNSGEDIILDSEEIKNGSEDLFQTLLDALDGEVSDTDSVQIQITVSSDFFDSVL